MYKIRTIVIFALIQKYNSLMRSMTDNTTHFTYLNTSWSSVSHTSTCRAAWLWLRTRKVRWWLNVRTVLYNTTRISEFFDRRSLCHFHSYCLLSHILCLSDFIRLIQTSGRICWPLRLRRRSAAAAFLGLRVRGPPGAWIYVACECGVFPGRGLCHGPITRHRGLLPSVVCLSVIEEPQRGGLGPLGL
jgi:hypothetical protein